MISIEAYRAKIGTFVMPGCSKTMKSRCKGACKTEIRGQRLALQLLIALATLLIIGCVEPNPGPKPEAIDLIERKNWTYSGIENAPGKLTLATELCVCNRLDVVIGKFKRDPCFEQMCWSVAKEIYRLASFSSTAVHSVVNDSRLLPWFLNELLMKVENNWKHIEGMKKCVNLLFSSEDGEFCNVSKFKPLYDWLAYMYISSLYKYSNDPLIVTAHAQYHQDPLPLGIVNTETSTNVNYSDSAKVVNSTVELRTEQPLDVSAKLGLVEGQKLHLSDVMAIAQTEEFNPLYRTLLEKLIMLDFRCRDATIEKFTNKHTSVVDKNKPKGKFFSKPAIPTLHPMDALFVCFQNSDVLLQQIIAEKLFLCRLAIPLVSPACSSAHRPACFNLWALRSIVGEWRENKTAIETSIVNHPLKVISFIRYGPIKLSKSALINDVMTEISHNTFFHRDCPQGRVKRLHTNGLIEAAFVFPTGSEQDTIEYPCMFTNLRGDASEFFHLAQTITDNTSYLFILVSDVWLTESTNRDQLVRTENRNKHVHLIIKASLNNEQYTDQICQIQSFIENSLNAWKISVIHKDTNKAEIKQDVLNTLQKILPMAKEMSIVQLSKLFQLSNIIIDESEESLKTCRVEAENIMRFLPCEASEGFKDRILPLQGVPWKEFVTLEREAKKVHGVIRNDKSVELSKKEIILQRNAQQELMKNISPPIANCLTRLEHLVSNETSQFALQVYWYRLYLDSHSRQILPQLREEYSIIWRTLRNATQNNIGEGDIKDIRLELAKIEKKIDNSCFGMEHILREFGQMYEALTEVGTNTKRLHVERSSLLKIGTRMLLTGNVLEVMNGDGNNLHVPMKWVTDILDNLKAIIGNKKKIFVLSIIGVQSSGKSTLLNAMLGLQFAVSAGRCTKGIYMQLVKTLHGAELPYDYILMVDTEGLRANELGQGKLIRDNELATMAIGLGDVTIVNVKGENHAEVQDILQIAVQAFLRMKSVNPKLRLHQKCIFVHQNVTSTNAKEKLMFGRQKMQESLDSIATEAALQEGIGDISHFSDVIEFDSQNDVWYFPDLWFGNPPMAHINPEYKLLVQQVKCHIFFNYGQRQKGFLTVNDLKNRIRDLWNAILSDDFVYSFRNSLELKAYSLLELEFNQICWDYDKALHESVTAAENKTTGASSVEQLDLMFVDTAKHVHKMCGTMHREAHNKLETFFEKHEHKTILAQWKNQRVDRLESLAFEKRKKAKTSLDHAKQKLHIALTDLFNRGHAERILRGVAKTLAAEHKKNALPDEPLEQAFESKIQTSLDELKQKWPEDTTNVAEEVLDVFLFILPDSLNSLILRELDEKCVFYQSLTQGKLIDISDKLLSVKDDISITKHLVKADADEKLCLMEVALFTKDLFRQIDCDIDNQTRTKCRFKASFAENVFRQVTPKLQKFHNIHAGSFNITSNYRKKIYTCIYYYLLRIFQNMHAEYEAENGLMAKLKLYKTTAWKLFKNLVQDRHEEEIAADMFCERIKGLVKDAVCKELYARMVRDISRVFSSKFRLIASILEDMARKDSVHNYIAYCNSANSYTLKWLMNFTNNGLFDLQGERTGDFTRDLWKASFISVDDGSNETVFASLAIGTLDLILDEIVKQIRNVPLNEETNLEKALDTFARSVNELLAISPIEFEQVKDHRHIKDIPNFWKLVVENLQKDLVPELKRFYKNENELTWRWNAETTPEAKAFDDLFGCTSECPFCGEPCQYGKDHNIDHSCIQHRIRGLSKVFWSQTKKLSCLSCSFAITTDYSFSCMHNTNADAESCPDCPPRENKTEKIIFHPYKQYKVYTPGWKIDPSPTNDNFKYWQWVMAKYNKEFATNYGREPADIPESWQNISKDDAIDSLREIYRRTDD